MFVESRDDLGCLTIVHRLHRPDHRTEANKLHHRRKMDDLIRTLFVFDSRMTPDGPLDCSVRCAERTQARMVVFDLGDHDMQGGPTRSCRLQQKGVCSHQQLLLGR